MRGHVLSATTLDVFGIPFNCLIAGAVVSPTMVYGIWMGLMLYPLCKWFNGYKQPNGTSWLSYRSARG